MRICIYIPMWLIWAGGSIVGVLSVAFVGCCAIAWREQMAPVHPAREMEFKVHDMAKHERMGGIESEWDGLARDLGEK